MKYVLFFLMISSLGWSGMIHPPPSEQVIVINGLENSKEAETIRNQIRVHLYNLAIEEDVSILVSFRDFSKIPPSADTKTHHCFSDLYQAFILYQRSFDLPAFHIIVDKELNLKQRSEVLAHEMIHVKQFIRGELVQQPPYGYVWKGKVFKDVRRIRHAYRPWEKEAKHQHFDLLRLWRKDGSAPLPEESKSKQLAKREN